MNNYFKNPYLNSIYAEVYIIFIVSFMQLIAKPNTPDSEFGFEGIAAISLLVLSVAVMGYLFFGQPIQLYWNGEKERAVSFFMKTVASFAVITLIIFLVLKVLS